MVGQINSAAALTIFAPTPAAQADAGNKKLSSDDVGLHIVPMYLEYDDLLKISTDGSLGERTLPGFSECNNVVVMLSKEGAGVGNLTLLADFEKFVAN